MKKIKLTQNKYALVDSEDFDILNIYNWYVTKTKISKSFYAKRMETIGGKRITITMANQIMGSVPKGKKEVDHIDGNGLNNQRKNLRWASRSENMRNIGKKKNNTSDYKCVYPVTKSNSWQVYVTHLGKKIYLGVFKTKELAAKRYNKFAKKFYKEFAKLNKI